MGVIGGITAAGGRGRRPAIADHPPRVMPRQARPASVGNSARDATSDRGSTVAKTDGTFIYVATYPDELTARDDYQVVKELHRGGLVGSYDAAVVTKDAEGRVHENKDETATRHGAWWGVAAGAAIGAVFPPAILGAAAAGGVIGGVSGHLAKGMSRSRAKELGEFIDPGEAGLIVVGDSKLQAAIQKAVTRAEKETAEELDVDPKDIDKTLRQAVGEM
jgi:uncharacterized membrane protein